MGFKNTLLPVATVLSSGGRLLDLSRPVVMGILNATPDSFYEGSLDMNEMLRLAEKMMKDGATILDVGGASSKPGAVAVSREEEGHRILPLIERLKKEFPSAWISIDTNGSTVAMDAVAAGADIVNDISAGSDEAMLETIVRMRVPYIAMHMQGTPATMQKDPQYANVVLEVFEYLKTKLLRCQALGIHDLILDPGFGFGKTVAHNFALLNELATFRALGRPLMAGVSRKSMICKPLKVNPDKALNGTTALHMAALREGASILRAHDVREAMQTIKLFELIAPHPAQDS